MILIYRISLIVFLSNFFTLQYAQKTALVIVDIQSAYFEGGSTPLVEPESASMEAAKILNHFRKSGQYVIHVQHNAAETGLIDFQDNTRKILIHEYVFPINGEHVITKAHPNSFKATLLDSLLTSLDIADLVICGMMTHMCVDATVRAAKDLGYNITLIGNACATKDVDTGIKTIPAAQVHEAFLAALNGYYATVVSADEWLKITD